MSVFAAIVMIVFIWIVAKFLDNHNYYHQPADSYGFYSAAAAFVCLIDWLCEWFIYCCCTMWNWLMERNDGDDSYLYHSMDAMDNIDSDMGDFDSGEYESWRSYNNHDYSPYHQSTRTADTSPHHHYQHYHHRHRFTNSATDAVSPVVIRDNSHGQQTDSCIQSYRRVSSIGASSYHPLRHLHHQRTTKQITLKSCLKKSASSSSAYKRNSVKFSTVRVRDYDVIRGDHPECTTGTPLSLGWSYKEMGQYNVASLVDGYSVTCNGAKTYASRHAMILTAYERQQFLRRAHVAKNGITISHRMWMDY